MSDPLSLFGSIVSLIALSGRLGYIDIPGTEFMIQESRVLEELLKETGTALMNTDQPPSQATERSLNICAHRMMALDNAVTAMRTVLDRTRNNRIKILLYANKYHKRLDTTFTQFRESVILLRSIAEMLGFAITLEYRKLINPRTMTMSIRSITQDLLQREDETRGRLMYLHEETIGRLEYLIDMSPRSSEMPRQQPSSARTSIRHCEIDDNDYSNDNPSHKYNSRIVTEDEDESLSREISRDTAAIISHTSPQSQLEDEDAEEQLHWIHRVQQMAMQSADQTIFPAILCPALPTGLRRLPAIFKLDTGSDVDIIDERLVEEAGLASLVREIPPAERSQIKGIMGFTWTPTRKITLKFYVHNGRKMHQTDFFLCPDLGFDTLISKTFLLVCGSPRRPLTRLTIRTEERAEQEELIRAQNARSLDYTRSRDQLKALERARRRLPPQQFRQLIQTGRTWTLEDSGHRRHMLTSGDGSDSLGLSSQNQGDVPSPSSNFPNTSVQSSSGETSNSTQPL